MSAAEILTPDFRRRTLDGRRIPRSADPSPAPVWSLADAPCVIRPVRPVDLPPGPDARRASPRLVDDFGIPATDPERISDLLLSFEAAPWRQEVIRVVRGLDGVSRVHIGHGDRTFLLDPADARLVATALQQEQAFEGAWGVAARIREAAMHADWARPYHRRDARGVADMGPVRQRIRPLAARPRVDRRTALRCLAWGLAIGCAPWLLAQLFNAVTAG